MRSTLKTIFCFYLFIPLISFAQQKIWFKEDFNNNEQNWSITNTTELSRTVENGKYIIQQKTGTSSYWVWKTVFIDNEKPYNVEMKFTMKEGKNRFGLVVSGKNNTTYIFSINPSEQSAFVEHYNGTWKTYFSGKKNKAILGLNQENTLTLSYKGGNVTFLVNGKKMYSTSIKKDFLDWADGTFGINVSGIGKSEVDRFYVYHDVEVRLLANMPTGLQITKLNNTINTEYCEVVPLVSPDGKTLYYSIKNSPKNVGGKEDTDDIWCATWQDTAWGAVKNLGKPLNNNSSNFVISVTPDNNMLFLSGIYNNNTSSAGFSTSYRTANGWSFPKPVTVKNYYNRASHNEFCMSADGKVLIMAIQRDETQGGRDLYVSFLKKDKTWTEPKNMGKTINGKNDEITPFLAADSKTLYFSSNSFPGYGDNDIFVSRRLNDDYTKWSEPENLGPMINSSAWEAYYTVPASGNFAYVSRGCDLFEIGLPKAARPKPVVLIEGKVLNSKDDTPLEAEISYYDAQTKEELGIARSNPLDGSFKIILPAGKSYTFNAEKENFKPTSEQIDATNITEYSEIHRNLYLTPKESEVKKTVTVTVKGTVYNAKTKTPMGATLTYRDAVSDQALGVIGSNPSTGTYSLVLPIGKDYNLSGTQENFIPASERISLANIAQNTEITKDLYLTPIEIGVSVRLNNIFFDFGKDVIRQEESLPELNRVIKFLKDNPEVVIEIGGHTDNVGSDENNQKLSQGRANAVKNFLVQHNLKESQISAKGYGESKPQATNDTDEGRQLNRRVEFTILKK